LGRLRGSYDLFAGNPRAGRSLCAAFAAALLLLAPWGPCRAGEVPSLQRFVTSSEGDFARFYADRQNLIRLGVGVAGAAVLANTNADPYLRDRYQADLRGSGTDRAARIFKVPGTVYVIGPAYVAAYGAGLLLRKPEVRRWAERSVRASVVGSPAVLALQFGLGAERPGDGRNSRWRPFHSSHGASGHAFFGGVPFITAAMMVENPYEKGLLYGASALAGLSRINDDLHYASQVALGWYLAYLSASVVRRGDTAGEDGVHFGVAPASDGWMVTAWGTF
jgi:hypothetical protein